MWGCGHSTKQVSGLGWKEVWVLVEVCRQSRLRAIGVPPNCEVGGNGSLVTIGIHTRGVVSALGSGVALGRTP